MKDHFPVSRPQFFFTTAPMPCPYIEGRQERKIVTELIGPESKPLHDTLSRAGFRRSHSIAYAPVCLACADCIPVRVIVERFSLSRSFHRTLRLNEDLVATIVPPRATAEQYQLFGQYQESRHNGSDMALMGFYDFRAMVEDSPVETCLVEFRNQEESLVSVCLTDTMDDGLSAVYSFFDPSYSSRSPGTFMILWLIEEARRRSLPYVYLGFWIEKSRKMSYKSRFSPLEAYRGSSWAPLEP